jgi:hypothetical protein
MQNCGRPERKPRRKWEDHIKMDLKGIVCESVDWTNMARDRVQRRALVNTVMKLRIPEKAGNFLTS